MIGVDWSFTWDERKEELNIKKHGVSFEHAKCVWLDPRAVEFYDDENSTDEDRFIRMGAGITGMSVLVVVFCEYDDDQKIIRLISARKATPRERKVYEKGI
jgi:uncharacterized DUF497 family protein